MVEDTSYRGSYTSEGSATVPRGDVGDPAVEEALEGKGSNALLKGSTTAQHPPGDRASKDAMTSEVAKFFAGRSVLVTGGSGFLGKVLVEKLLRSCPQIREVFILLRAGRKGESQEQRMRMLLSETPFLQLEERFPGSLAKVRAIAGDVSAPDLGISPDDRRLLVERVSVIFHSAANITFTAPITEAIETNLQGTRRILQLCKDIPHLQSLVYVSTAFCNCKVKGKIDERVLGAPCEPEWLINKVAEMGPKEMEEVTPSLLFGHPNTYTLTKLLAEKSIQNERGHIPTAIVRPSIVMGALEEPLPGWVDNANGASSFLAGALYGVFRCIMAGDDVVAELIPSDLVVNQIITAAWSVSERRSEGWDSETEVGPLEVFHCTSGQVNPITWGEYASMGIQSARKNPCKGVVWYPAVKCRSSPLRNTAASFLLHTIPSRLIEVISKMQGKTEGSRLVRLQGAYSKGMQHTRFVTTRQWSFEGSNAAKLNRRLNQADRAIFSSDPSSICWPIYIERCILGLRHFYFKQSPESLPAARKAVKKLRRTHLVAQLLLFALCWAFGSWLTGSYDVKSLVIGVLLTVALRAI